ncbi:hypothetical protein SAMN05421874_105253 [Nonomuraea maritima]|uniref:Uncharacterized protein n=1 Tax=Nonomuraea maritima TaxID=683260 RepID=A0A1G8ZH23_9ACTN|nr:hypothetical protein [Nonomuraea maritima]SDK13695.1 hypothetical protein SAMN05421874_105253 [Nonomuraea maritima]
MNAELDYTIMQHHAAELRQAAAEHRRVTQARTERPAERRSVFARFLVP